MFSANAVVGVVESRNQNQIVGNIKISVTGRKALAAEYHRARQRQLDQRELFAVESAGGFEAFHVFGQRCVIRVGRVRLDGGNNRRRRNKSGNVVYVAVGVVAGQAAIEPNCLTDPRKS